MIKTIYKIFFVCCACLGAISCNPYTQIAKSADKDLIYDSAFECFEIGKYSHAKKLFTAATPFFLGTEREDTIAFYSAASSYKSGDFTTSSSELDDFRRRYTRSPFLEDAAFMYAKGFYYASPAVEKDQMVTEIAIYNINEYLERYPRSIKKDDLLANIQELEDKLYHKSFLNAYTYYKIGRYKAAVAALKNSADANPDSPYREQTLFLIAKSGYLLAKNSYAELQQDRYLNVLDYYYNFAAEFPESKYTKEILKIEDSSKAFLEKLSAREQKLEQTKE